MKKMKKHDFLKWKKQNLDGFEGYSYYYHDLIKDKRVMLRRKMSKDLQSFKMQLIISDKMKLFFQMVYLSL